LGCEDEIIDMVNGFIDRKKSSIEDTNNEREENLHVLDPFVQKRRGRPPQKRIKSASESSSHRSNTNSAINPLDPNLYIRAQQSQSSSALRSPLQTLNINVNEKPNTILTDASIAATQVTNIKRRYACKICGESGHNAQKCNKQHK